MTVGHIIEMLQGKLAAMRGEAVDATPFSVSAQHRDSADPDAIVKEIGRCLRAYGFAADGTDIMYDGRTGRKMAMPVFLGPMTYQALKHMTNDKFHARGRGGPVSVYTRQPLEGRMRNGGQRFGEMERDVLLAQGTANMVQDRLLIASDQAQVPVCVQCHRIAQPPKRRTAGDAVYAAAQASEQPFCTSCLRSDTVRFECMPYAFKTAMQVFEGLHVNAGLVYRDSA